MIDTEAVITAGATSYMFYGRADGQSVDSDSFWNYLYSAPNW